MRRPTAMEAERKWCPVCEGREAVRVDMPNGFDGYRYECPNCGNYLIDRVLKTSELPRLRPTEQAMLSNLIWERQTSSNVPFEIRSGHLDAMRELAPFGPREQLDRLVLHLGRSQRSPGAFEELPYGCLRAKIGAVSNDDERFIVNAAKNEQLVDTSLSHMRAWEIGLTMRGWLRFEELQRGAVVSRTAFMAMPFGNPEVTHIVDSVFRPAVDETGFTLKKLDDDPKAGLIDDKIRVDIRLSRFLIADLTGANLGAYWEAGYAEGLGKPVIYTCSRSHFDEQKPHFDTNHCTTVIWDAENTKEAADNLKATIRNTFPAEAIMPKD